MTDVMKIYKRLGNTVEIRRSSELPDKSGKHWRFTNDYTCQVSHSMFRMLMEQIPGLQFMIEPLTVGDPRAPR